jgi:hypothetical protein
MENQASAAKQPVVIGGSLGGLFAGLLLRSIRWDVDIYERSPHDLDSRGGGIVLHQGGALEAKGAAARSCWCRCIGSAERPARENCDGSPPLRDAPETARKAA